MVALQCDGLDGAADGLVNDVAACRSAFNPACDVPTCLGNIFGGLKNSAGSALHADFPYDAGINSANWVRWKFLSSIGNQRDPVAVGFIFSTPPAPTTMLANTKAYALAYNLDSEFPKISATNSTYTESSLSFMTPPNPSALSTLKKRGAKLMLYHGLSDRVFSPDDTAQWYDGVRSANGGDARNFARLYLVPSMNHCSGGPAADQFNMTDALVKWVEQGHAPDSVVASARGTGNAGGANAELPAGWSATRTRPLCPYPTVARYKGSGNIEEAASFECR